MVVGELVRDVEVLVIGGGPGGYTAAIRAAQLGKKVTLIEKEEIGGVCLNQGCIPSKALITAGKKFNFLQQADEMGIEVKQSTINFTKMQNWKNNIVKRLTSGVNGLLSGNKVEVLKGEAFFINNNEVRVENGYESDRIRFQDCIIATGSRPVEIPGIPFGNKVLSSKEVLNLKEVPKELIILGGGYIGIELGQAYALLGAKVTILEEKETILNGFNKRAVNLVKQNLHRKSVDLLTSIKINEVTNGPEKVHLSYLENNEVKELSGDYLLVTAGRRPNTDELSLDILQMIVDDRGYIAVDHQCMTSVKNIYAIGDIISGPALAHKAAYEGKVVAEVIAGKPSAVDYQTIPLVVFSDPEIASVGLTENDAIKEGHSIKVGRFSYGANGRALTLNETEGSITLVVEKSTELVLGAQIVGEEASELISEITLAIEMGATIYDLIDTIHAHPTLSEIVLEASEAAIEQAIHVL